VIRICDILLSLLGLICLSPIFLIIAVLIKINSKGPVFYRQSRIGLDGIHFEIFKFRSMLLDSEKLGLITIGARDNRVTSVGYFLRRLKLDELPQLINVLIGNMSLVGPRPEVKKYVDLYSFEQRQVLSIRPGITDWASIYYRDENRILEKSLDAEYDYIHIILPDKIKYNLIYINKRNLIEYLKIIFYTIWMIPFSMKKKLSEKKSK
jgi:lipopolysaccharide/colanic/teichoic acid biosynthesis glycosyltransferase